MHSEVSLVRFDIRRLKIDFKLPQSCIKVIKKGFYLCNLGCILTNYGLDHSALLAKHKILWKISALLAL